MYLWYLNLIGWIVLYSNQERSNLPCGVFPSPPSFVSLASFFKSTIPIMPFEALLYQLILPSSVLISVTWLYVTVIYLKKKKHLSLLLSYSLPSKKKKKNPHLAMLSFLALLSAYPQSHLNNLYSNLLKVYSIFEVSSWPSQALAVWFWPHNTLEQAIDHFQIPKLSGYLLIFVLLIPFAFSLFLKIVLSLSIWKSFMVHSRYHAV